MQKALVQETYFQKYLVSAGGTIINESRRGPLGDR